MTQGPAALGLPQPRDTPTLASPWPHRLTSSTSARAATTARALPPCPSSVFSKSFHVRGTLRGAGSARKRWRRFGRGPAGPCALSTFLHKFAWKRAEAVGLNQPAEGDGAICQRFRRGFRAEGPWPSASAWPLSRTPTSSPWGSRPGSSWRPRGTSGTPTC